MAETEITTTRRRGRAELIAALANARAGITTDAVELADRVNVPRRIRRSIADSPLKRAATALLAGLAGSRLLTKSRPRSRKAGPAWLQRHFPNLDLKKIVRLLLVSYLEPEKIDLRAWLREQLRDFLK